MRASPWAASEADINLTQCSTEKEAIILNSGRRKKKLHLTAARAKRNSSPSSFGNNTLHVLFFKVPSINLTLNWCMHGALIAGIRGKKQKSIAYRLATLPGRGSRSLSTNLTADSSAPFGFVCDSEDGRSLHQTR